MAIPNAELRPIRSNWGHRAGNPQQSLEDTTAIQQAVNTFLAKNEVRSGALGPQSTSTSEEGPRDHNDP